MSTPTTTRTLAVSGLVALGCSLLVGSSVYLLRPLQLAHGSLVQYVAVLDAVGFAPDAPATPNEIAALMARLEPVVIDLDAATLTDRIDARGFDARAAEIDPTQSVPIPPAADVGGLSRRARYAVGYLWRDHGVIRRIVLPVSGRGMWSTIYGYVALESDLNTIAGLAFYEHGETPGIGDRILEADWRGSWIGKRIYGSGEELQLRVVVVATGRGRNPEFEVDAISGATVTSTAIGNMMRYWFGRHGYQPFLAALASGGGADRRAP